MDLVTELDKSVENFKLEFAKFERGNKSAGTRARKSLQDIKKISQDLRNYIQGAKKDDDEADK